MGPKARLQWVKQQIQREENITDVKLCFQLVSLWCKGERVFDSFRGMWTRESVGW